MTEHELRKVMASADDLEPPTDDLFAQRALSGGRARLGRRRRAVLGAAAGLAVVGAVGGTWLVQHPVATPTSGGMRAESASGGDSVAGPTEAEPLARDASGWLSGRDTPQATALEELAPSLLLRYPDVFGGAYALDDTNTRLVVTVTRREPTLEQLVRSSLPSPADVEFVVVANSAVRKQETGNRVVADATQWREKGVTIVGVRVDARDDRVVVTVREPAGVPIVEQHYGADIVTAVQGAGPPLGGAVTDPTTVPTLP